MHASNEWKDKAILSLRRVATVKTIVTAAHTGVVGLYLQLVYFFSATGNLKTLAEQIVRRLGTRLVEKETEYRPLDEI